MPTIVLPKPLPHQIPILANPARFKLVVCGRRWGKTAAGLMAAVLGHGPRRSALRGAIDGGKVWWVAPSYPQIVSSGIWGHLKRACAGATRNKSEVNRRIELIGGGSVTVRSADNEDSLRGPGLDGLIIDEASRISREIWHDALRPALADKGGWAMFLTTPNGKNWFHKLFEASADRPGWERWQLPTSDNPLVTPAELEAIELEIGPRAFAQEHLAQFTDFEGALFPAAYFGESMWATGWPDRFELSVLAIDPAKGEKKNDKGDFTALVFVGLFDGTLWISAEIERHTPMETVAAALRMYERHGPTAVAFEANGFQSTLSVLFDQHCREYRLPPLPLREVYNHETKAVRIQRLDPHLARGRMRFERCTGCDRLIEQLQMFPDKHTHDDGADALELAIRALNMLARERT
jgi:predicted phage terminase large subunit-like protein